MNTIDQTSAYQTNSARGTANELHRPLLSIVVTSYTIERLNDIFELLDSINSQTYRPIETIFVAETSQELYQRLKETEITQPDLNLRVIFNNGRPGLPMARNLGLAEAKGDIIAFVDDDVVLFPDWAEETVKTYDDCSVIGVTGPGLPLWEDESLNWLPKELYWITSCTAFAELSEMQPVRSAWGMNMSFRKEAFSHSLFGRITEANADDNESWKSYSGEDAIFSIDIRLKTGKSIMYNPKAQVWHKVHAYRLSKKFARGQAYCQGYFKALLRKRFKQDHDTQGLVRELSLLKRMVVHLGPRIAAGFFRNPRIAWKRFNLTFIVLLYVTLGYLMAAFPALSKVKPGGFKRQYESN